MIYHVSSMIDHVLPCSCMIYHDLVKRASPHLYTMLWQIIKVLQNGW